MHFLASLINGVCILVMMIAMYFGFFLTIKIGTLSDQMDAKSAAYDIVLNVGTGSGLLKTNDSNTMLYTGNSYYEFFLGTILKYDFESDIYDLNEDPDGYKKYQEKFDAFKKITIHDGFVDDDYVGNFYTKFILDRTDSTGQKLVDYDKNAAIPHYFKEVMHFDDPNLGGKFFKYVDDSNYPHLIDNTRSLLFGYAIKQVTTNEMAQLDREFYNYFIKVFMDAQSLLMKDSEYKTAYDAFEKANTNIVNYEYTANYVTLVFSIVFMSFIFPFFNKKRANPGELITGSQRVNDDGEFNIKNKLLLLLASFFKYYHLIFIIGMLGESQVLTRPILNIIGFDVNALFFVVISVVYCVASIIYSVINKEHRNLDALISQTNMCFAVRKSVNNTPSGTVSE